MEYARVKSWLPFLKAILFKNYSPDTIHILLGESEA